ncbi:MAG: hypothetical protein V3T05_13655 [Myxococcota bacterium]
MVRIVVYVMLVLSAGAAFWLGDRLWEAVRDGRMPIWVALIPPTTFTLFVLVYAVDRWLLVKRRGVPIARACLQVVFALLFVGLLWPHQASELRATRRSQEPDRAVRLLRHADPDVRAAMCELIALRAQVTARDRITAMADGDKSPDVRDACRRALSRLETIAAGVP